MKVEVSSQEYISLNLLLLLNLQD